MVKAAGAGVSLKAAWKHVVDTADDVRGIPIIVALLGACAVLLDGTSQGQDLAQTSAGQNGETVWLFVATVLLGVQGWFWTRAIVVENCGLVRENWPAGPILTWAPRLLGFAPFAIAAIPLARSRAPHGLEYALVLLAVGVALFALLTARARLTVRLAGKRTVRHSALKAGGRTFAWASYGLALVAMLVVIVDPVRPAQHVGAIAVVFLGIALIIPVLARAMHFGVAWRAPVLSLLALYSGLLTLFVDNHAVGRRAFGPALAPSALGSSPAGRPDLKSAFDRWYAHASTLSPTGAPAPIIFVSAEGGASRAGYWAAEVLGLLQEKSEMRGRFADSVFAISSVSGGSVGATAFVSQLHDNAAVTGFDEAIKSAAGGDFLSPTLAGLLFPDLLQRFVPFAILPDRAEALERAFEAGWADHCRKVAPCDAALWRKPFLDLWTGARPWTPALFINGTRQEDGRRVITSNIRIDPNVFPNAVDFYAVSGGDVRVSTAIHNGARFPLVSPGGTLGSPGVRQGHVLDGGYYDSNGTVTLRDLAAAVLAIARSEGRRLKPIFIELNNDSDAPTASPALVRGSYTPATTAALAPSATHDFSVDLGGPLDGLSSVRDSHGVSAAVSFSQEIAAANSVGAAASGAAPPSGGPPEGRPAGGVWGEHPTYRMIHLCRIEGRGMPMDWALSPDAKDVSAAATGFQTDGTDPCLNRQTIRTIEADYLGPRNPA